MRRLQHSSDSTCCQHALLLVKSGNDARESFNIGSYSPSPDNAESTGPTPRARQGGKVISTLAELETSTAAHILEVFECGLQQHSNSSTPQ